MSFPRHYLAAAKPHFSYSYNASEPVYTASFDTVGASITLHKATCEHMVPLNADKILGQPSTLVTANPDLHLTSINSFSNVAPMEESTHASSVLQITSAYTTQDATASIVIAGVPFFIRASCSLNEVPLVSKPFRSIQHLIKNEAGPNIYEQVKDRVEPHILNTLINSLHEYEGNDSYKLESKAKLQLVEAQYLKPDMPQVTDLSSMFDINVCTHTTAVQQMQQLQNLIDNILNYHGDDAYINDTKAKLQQLHFDWTNAGVVGVVKLEASMGGSLGNEIIMGGGALQSGKIPTGQLKLNGNTITTKTVPLVPDITGGIPGKDGSLPAGSTFATGTILNSMVAPVENSGVDLSFISNNPYFIGNFPTINASYAGWPNTLYLFTSVGDVFYQANSVFTNPTYDTTIHFTSADSGGFSIVLAGGQGMTIASDDYKAAETFSARLNEALSGLTVCHNHSLLGTQCELKPLYLAEKIKPAEDIDIHQLLFRYEDESMDAKNQTVLVTELLGCLSDIEHHEVLGKGTMFHLAQVDDNIYNLTW